MGTDKRLRVASMDMVKGVYGQGSNNTLRVDVHIVRLEGFRWEGYRRRQLAVRGDGINRQVESRDTR